jgi:hypothetical protein
MEESGAIAGIAPDHYDYNAPVGVYCKTCAVQCREDGATYRRSGSALAALREESLEELRHGRVATYLDSDTDDDEL